MIRDPEMIGYIPDNTNKFICIDCIDKREIDLDDIGEEENTPILYGDYWKSEIGPCIDCGTLAEEVKP